MPVSIVCVFNSPEVRQDCLDRSVERLRGEAPDVEYIPVDNVDSAFPSAGAALNHGARLARHDYVVFVHQDVYLHSLAALERAAGILAGPDGFGVLGACGIDHEGRVIGRVRDRVVLIGDVAQQPQDVDSLDEVLFMAPRSLLLEHPLSEHPDLAWHAYAVEYGLRVRGLGLRVGAADIPLTHNSLTVNLARLHEAHAAVAKEYPALVPIRTTCGTITDRTPTTVDREPFLAAHRWRYRWLRTTRTAHAARRAADGAPVVLNDIRLDIDEVIAAVPAPFHVLNLEPAGLAAGSLGTPEPLDLLRRGRPVTFRAGDVRMLAEVLRARDPGTPMLVTNLGIGDLGTLARLPGTTDRIVGWHESAGYWLLLGCPADVLPAPWRGAQATPLGLRALA